MAVPQLGPLLQHWALTGIRDGWRWGEAQPEYLSDGLVPGSVAGEGMEEGAEGCPLIGFTVTQWTMEQVEAEREGQQSEREVRVVYWMVPGETRQGNPLSLKLGGVILEPSLNKAKPL